MATQLSVLVVASEEIFGQGLSLLVQKLYPGTKSRVAYTNAEATAALTRGTPALIIVDIRGNQTSKKRKDASLERIKLLGNIRENGTRSRLLVLFDEISDRLHKKLEGLGSCTVLPRDCRVDEFKLAIHDAVGRNYTLSPIAPSSDPLDELSKRERQIFLLLADGIQSAAIAKKLFISPRTVETHRARIVRKLGIKTNGELIRYAIRTGVIGA